MCTQNGLNRHCRGYTVRVHVLPQVHLNQFSVHKNTSNLSLCDPTAVSIHSILSAHFNRFSVLKNTIIIH